MSCKHCIYVYPIMKMSLISLKGFTQTLDTSLCLEARKYWTPEGSFFKHSCSSVILYWNIEHCLKFAGMVNTHRTVKRDATVSTIAHTCKRKKKEIECVTECAKRNDWTLHFFTFQFRSLRRSSLLLHFWSQANDRRVNKPMNWDCVARHDVPPNALR